VSFGAFEADIDAFAARLRVTGVRPANDQDHPTGNGLWFRDPNGMIVEIRAAPKVMPDAKQIAISRSSERGAPMRGENAVVRPRRLSHALFFTPDIQASIDFYTEALGLRLSDHPGPVAFLHGAHGSDHHLIAFAQSPDGIGYHHSAWDVASIDEVGLGAAQMASAEFTRGRGFGRHVLGSNYFFYVRDPWGSYAEYSFDIDFVPAEQDWSASFPNPENSLYLWGPDVPEGFVKNYEPPA
jgi:catechol 2,3-dioxygenase-like lactoylglutathione lyase family enzyme